jgi:hypothetical integral membrane protein (TIGR02206 family)
VSEHFIVPFFSTAWFWGMFACFGFVVAGMVWVKNSSDAGREVFVKTFGVAILSLAAFNQVYFWLIMGTGDIRISLPLQLCDMSMIICGLVLLNRHQFSYEWALMVAFPSAFHTILTPEISHGFSWFLVFEFFISHASQILAPLILTYYFGFRPRPGSWWRVFIVVNFILVAVFCIDWLVGANYIYLMEKPANGNPILIGPWPWYILVVEFVGLLHVILFYLFFRSKTPQLQPIEATVPHR